MSRSAKPYPVVDVFAGPGGLGEGFASLLNESGTPRFESIIAIERDSSAYQTLLLRHFLRRFKPNEFPDDYYRFLRGGIDLDELYRNHPTQCKHASQSALRISLGPESHAAVKQLVKHKTANLTKWALVGGPPCQAYSLVGRSRMKGLANFEADERHTLYLEYLKLIADHKPPVFVMENVKGLLSATIGGKSTISQIVSDLANPRIAVESASSDLKYKLFSLSEMATQGEVTDARQFIVKAEKYGVPQARHRMFIVGIRDDIPIIPKRLRSQPAPTVRQMIGGLPQIRSELSRGNDSLENWRNEIAKLSNINTTEKLSSLVEAKAIATQLKLPALNEHDVPGASFSKRYLKSSVGRHPVAKRLYDTRLDTLTSHEARSHMPSDLRRYMFAAVFASATGRSPKLADFPHELLPAHQNVELGCSGKMFSDRFRVQLADQVATTITSHISKDGHYFIHYDPVQCRSLTVREAARIQTFPDNYHFVGNRTSQFHQVGNAVPPYLAEQIAEIIAEVFDCMKSQKSTRAPYGN